jgi:hypothetical protein
LMPGANQDGANPASGRGARHSPIGVALASSGARVRVIRRLGLVRPSPGWSLTQRGPRGHARRAVRGRMRLAGCASGATWVGDRRVGLRRQRRPPWGRASHRVGQRDHSTSRRAAGAHPVGRIGRSRPRGVDPDHPLDDLDILAGAVVTITHVEGTQPPHRHVRRRRSEQHDGAAAGIIARAETCERQDALHGECPTKALAALSQEPAVVPRVREQEDDMVDAAVARPESQPVSSEWRAP